MQQGVEEQARVVLDRPHLIGGEELREHSIEQGAVLQDVGDAARHAAIILEDEVPSLAVADDVGADHVGEDPARRNHVQELALVFLAREHDLGRHDAVLEALLTLIYVEDEEVQGRDPLDQPGLQAFPLA